MESSKYGFDWMPEDPLEREIRLERLGKAIRKINRKPNSMTYQVEVIGITGPSFVKTQRGGYNTLEVAYKRDGKVAGKKMVDFTNPVVFELFSKAKQGEVYTVTAEKDKNDYWQWTAAELATASAPQSAGEATEEAGSPEAGNSSGSPATNRRGANGAGNAANGRGKVTGSNYETPEERARNRACIRRQACLNTAVASLSEGEKANVTVEQIIKLAEQFEVWVLEAK